MSNIKTIGQVANHKSVRQYGMEELAFQLRSTKPSGGVLFARHSDRLKKDEARQLILDLFHPSAWPGPLHMMTMPGVNWRFERLLLGQRQPGWLKASRPNSGNYTFFTGFENDRAIYHGSITQMPGVETPDRLIRPIKKERYPFAELALKTRYVSFFFANIDDVIAHEWEGCSDRDRYKIGWDAVWLDYTGPLTARRMDRIAQFYRRFVRDTLIVTVLKARWDRDTSKAIRRAGGHSQWLRKRLRGEVLHDVEYSDTSPMAQFAVRHWHDVAPRRP